MSIRKCTRFYHNDKNEVSSDAVARPGGMKVSDAPDERLGTEVFRRYSQRRWRSGFVSLCNGHPDDGVEKECAGVKFLEPLLSSSQYRKSFEKCQCASGPIFSRPPQGAAWPLGDFDNDGSVDVLVKDQNNGAPVLLRNNAGFGRTAGWECAFDRHETHRSTLLAPR